MKRPRVTSRFLLLAIAVSLTGTWDDAHIRPKTFVKLKGWYYVFYKGARPRPIELALRCEF